MAATGTFGVVDYAALRSRMIISQPKTTTTTTAKTAPPPRGVPTPKTVPAPNVDPVISAPQSIPGGPVIITDTHLGDPLAGAGSGSTGTTGGTGGTVTDPGSTGGGSSNDTALLLNALGSLFNNQDVGQSMAPVSFEPTGGETSATTTDGGGGSSMGAIIFLLVLVAGGAYWYFHR